MKNKILILAFLLMSSSCSIFKNSQTISEKDTKEANDEFASVNIYQRFLGDYSLEIMNIPKMYIPSGSDGSFTMKVKMDGDILKSEYTGDSIGAANWAIIKSTEVEDDILFVEIHVPDYGVTGYWELYVEDNEVTGYAFDMFEVVGTISR
tara:strand:+ start:101 stop:550 length:450 start_codon:yes stop_codon:yes gene_type:complete